LGVDYPRPAKKARVELFPAAQPPDQLHATAYPARGLFRRYLIHWHHLLEGLMPDIGLIVKGIVDKSAL
jgi:hypothetical protein